jgi:hypothetical protein
MDTATPTSALECFSISLLVQGHVGVRHRQQGQGHRLDHHIVDRQLIRRGLPCIGLAHGSRRIDLGSKRQELVDPAISGQVKMRDRAFRLDEAARDCFPHGIMRYDLVAALLEKLADHLVGHALRNCTGSLRRRGGFG